MTTTHEEAYLERRYNLLRAEEGYEPTPYADTKGIPTIGVGVVISFNTGAVYNYAFGDISKLTGSALTAERAFRASVTTKITPTYDPNGPGTAQINAALAPVLKSRSFAITEEQAKVLFNNDVAPDHENEVDAKFGAIPDGDQRLALFSLAYNNAGKLLGPGLVGAVGRDDQAEAWYEIRYDSNGDNLAGIAKRRYYESEIYSTNSHFLSPSESEARDLLTTRSRHIEKITIYDAKYDGRVASANREYSTGGNTLLTTVHKSDDDFQAAKTVLINKYAPGSGVDEVILDYKPITAGVQAANETNVLTTSAYTIKNGALILAGDGNDKITGSAKNDYIVGEAGDDKIDAGAGSDTVVYQGKETDYDIRRSEDGQTWTVRDARSSFHEGTDTLINVENIQFADGKSYKLADHGLTFESDFAFVIDTTGSMGGPIGSVKAQAAEIINKIFGDSSLDARIAVGAFKDVTDGEPSYSILNFTDQDAFADRKAAALAAINSIGVGGGGDEPETDFDGLKFALTGGIGKFRTGAAGSLKIALFTDASVKDAYLSGEVASLARSLGVAVTKSDVEDRSFGTISTFTMSSVASATDAAAIASSYEVQIFTIFVGPDGIDTKPLQDIADATSGKFFNTDSTTSLVDALLQVITAPPPPTIPDPGTGSGSGSGPGSAGQVIYVFNSMEQSDADHFAAGNTLVLGALSDDTHRISIMASGDADVILTVDGKSLVFSQAALSGSSLGGQVVTTDGSRLLIGIDAADDTISQLSAAQTFAYGMGGSDSVTVGDGANVVAGGSGADTIHAGNGNNHIFGNSPSTIQGSDDGGDDITAGSGSNYVQGNAGDDTIIAGIGTSSSGYNRVFGGADNDTITVYGGLDSRAAINGNKGDDTITDASNGTNVMRGGMGDDQIAQTGASRAVIKGDIGADNITVGTAAGHLAVITGGPDGDQFNFDGTGAGAIAYLKADGTASTQTDPSTIAYYQQITDFTQGVDHIHLAVLPLAGSVGHSDLVFASVADAQTFAQSQIGSTVDGITIAVSSLSIGNASSANTYLLYSDGGDGSVSGIILLDGVAASTLNYSSFI